jgi:hypothetical protein
VNPFGGSPIFWRELVAQFRAFSWLEGTPNPRDKRGHFRPRIVPVLDPRFQPSKPHQCEPAQAGEWASRTGPK